MEPKENGFYQLEGEFLSLVPAEWDYRVSAMFCDWNEILGYREVFQNGGIFQNPHMLQTESGEPQKIRIHEDYNGNKILRLEYNDMEIYLKGLLEGLDTKIEAIVRDGEEIFVMALLHTREFPLSNIKSSYGNSNLEGVLKKIFLNNKKEQK